MEYPKSFESRVNEAIAAIISTPPKNWPVEFLSTRNRVDLNDRAEVVFDSAEFANAALKIVSDQRVVSLYRQFIVDKDNIPHRIPRSDGTFSNGLVVCGLKRGLHVCLFEDSDGNVKQKMLDYDIYNLISSVQISELKIKLTERKANLEKILSDKGVNIPNIPDNSNLEALIRFVDEFGAVRLNLLLKDSSETPKDIQGYYRIQDSLRP